VHMTSQSIIVFCSLLSQHCLRVTVIKLLVEMKIIKIFQTQYISKLY